MGKQGTSDSIVRGSGFTGLIWMLNLLGLEQFRISKCSSNELGMANEDE